jgi:phage recombination protein Bet
MSQTAELASRNGDGPSLEARRYRTAVKETMRKREPGLDGRSHRVEPSDGEVDRFILEARLYGLEPLAGQIYASWQDGEMRAVVPLDGLRVLAARTGAYDGQADPEWCDAEGAWRDFWAGEDHPTAARVRVYKKDTRVPTTGTANWSDFAPTSTVGGGSMWNEAEGMPAHMLSIRAEALALRKAFPAQLSGLYTAEELGISLPGETSGGPAAADVPTSVIYAPPASSEPAGAPEPPPPVHGPSPAAIVDPPESQPSGAPALPRSRLTLAEVLASTGYERLRGELVDALFGVMPDRLTDEQAARMAAALREADAAGITAAELERTCKIALRDGGEHLEQRSRAILEWIAERHSRAVAAPRPPAAGDPDGKPSGEDERPAATDAGEER